jgi:GH25 family lysozyme M1 (1,4-beta-N-acetylmuramidase)
VRDLPLGFDINQDNGDRTEGLTEFAALKQVGKIFGIAKLAQAGVDQAFDTRYPLIRDAGMIRGSYDFFAPVDVGDQIAFVVDHVKRLTPGDLAPAIDLEDGSRALDRKYNYSSSAAGRNSLFVDISTWLDAVEARLGRAPIIYTGVLWREQFNAANFPNLPDMSVYPLWTAHPIPVAEDDHASGEVLNGWSDYTFWQYAEDKRGDKKKGAPARLWGIDPYIEPGTERFDGIDYNAFNGSIYGLRGLADLGHTAPHVAGNRESIAYTAPDGNLHLLEWAAGAWSDQDLSSAAPVAAQGDPAAIATELEQVILYRTADGAVIALTRPLADVNAPWSVATIATDAIDDPFVVRIGNEFHAVYWDNLNEQIHMFRAADGTWQREQAGDPTALLPPPEASGSGVVYVYQNGIHVVSRAGPDGHLVDIFKGNGGRPFEDFTSTSADGDGQAPPAATYRPTTYTPSGAAPRVVFRGVRGSIWQVERDTLAAKNLTLAASAPAAAGSPSAVFTDRCYIIYRGTNGAINVIYDDAGTWRTVAAADPTAYVDLNGNVAVSFFANDGVHVARLVNGTWV